MTGRDPSEEHRQASFLELFFDLCFVVAIAQAAAALHHAVAADHLGTGLIIFLQAFFAIWWAWMNFTWLASAYDNDDLIFRLVSFLQIIGALILAAGVSSGFDEGNFDISFIGFVVMRIGLVSLWLRAARHDPARRKTAVRYAIGLTLAMCGWSLPFFLGAWPVWAFLILATLELIVPIWAERAGATRWHPGHIAERYGLFTIIVLGESVLAATTAVRTAMADDGVTTMLLVEVVGGGLLILFSFWWLYFARSAERFLGSRSVTFTWGYGHYFIFAAAAALGAGLAVNVDQVAGNTAIGPKAAAASVVVPAAIYVLSLWIFHHRPHHPGPLYGIVSTIGALLMIGSIWTPAPILVTGLTAAAMVTFFFVRAHRSPASRSVSTS